MASLDALPSEMICLITKTLPLESIVALTTCSKTILHKLGNESWTRIQDRHFVRLRWLLLLSRDLPERDPCIWCARLHHPLDEHEKDGTARSCADRVLFQPSSQLMISLSAVAAALLRAERGMDYRYALKGVDTSRPLQSFYGRKHGRTFYHGRISGGRFILRTQTVWYFGAYGMQRAGFKAAGVDAICPHFAWQQGKVPYKGEDGNACLQVAALGQVVSCPVCWTDHCMKPLYLPGVGEFVVLTTWKELVTITELMKAFGVFSLCLGNRRACGEAAERFDQRQLVVDLSAEDVALVREDLGIVNPPERTGPCSFSLLNQPRGV